MNRQCVYVGAIALSLGILAGSAVGYRVGLAADAKPSEPSRTDGTLPTTAHLPHKLRIVEIEEHSSSMDEAFRATTIPIVELEDDSLWDLISLLQCRSAENNLSSGGIHVAIGHPLIHSPDLHKTRFTYSARGASALEILDALSEQTGITYSIRPCAVLWGKNVDAEQLEEALEADRTYFRDPSSGESNSIGGALLLEEPEPPNKTQK